MKPRGTQFKNLRRVSKVANTSSFFVEVVRTRTQRWKMSENSPHIWFFRSLAFSETICSAEKSKISSLMVRVKDTTRKACHKEKTKRKQDKRITSRAWEWPCYSHRESRWFCWHQPVPKWRWVTYGATPASKPLVKRRGQIHLACWNERGGEKRKKKKEKERKKENEKEKIEKDPPGRESSWVSWWRASPGKRAED